MMSDRLSWAMDELDLKHSERKQWLLHLHFAKLPLSGLSDVGANFIPYLVSSDVSYDNTSIMRVVYLSFHLINQLSNNLVMVGHHVSCVVPGGSVPLTFLAYVLTAICM